MNDASVTEAAELLLDLRHRRATIDALPEHLSPSSLDQAYAIQDAMHESAGWPIAVLKVGCTSEIAQQVLAIPHPIAGQIPADGRRDSGASIDRSFFGAPPLIECEIAVRIDGQGTIDAVAPAIELVDSRVTTLGGLSTVADNSAGCAVVLGAELPVDDLEELTSCEISLRSNGESLAAGSGAAVLGGPQGSVDWLVEHELSRGRPATRDDIWIITGTCTGLTPTEFGRTYTADYGELGSVSFSLV